MSAHPLARAIRHLNDIVAGGSADRVGLPAVQAKVTMVLGSMDQMTPPRATREIAAALKARVVTLPSGHSLPAEVPDGLLAALRDALA